MPNSSATRPRAETAPFGTLPDGRSVHAVTLTAPGGLRARILTLGGILQALVVPGRTGPADVVLGYDDVEGYLSDTAYLGVTVGRVAGRIGGSRFELEGETYELEPNEGPNHLHGGLHGFHRRLWQATPFEQAEAAGVTLTLASPDGDGGYPGALEVEVRYTLLARGALHIDYQARSSRPTPVSLTNHAYFNLAGHAAGDTATHRLTLRAARYLPIDDALLPLGTRADVAGTPFDFRAPQPLGARRDAAHPQLTRAGGYDHTYVLDATGDATDGAQPTAVLRDPASGRRLRLYTSAPCLQLYDGHKLAPASPGKDGVRYEACGGLCLETQGYPDALNQPAFPASLATPERPYRAHATYVFDTV